MLVRPAIKFCWNCYNWPDEILCNIFLPESSILSLAATAFLLSLWPLLQYCIIFPPAEDLQAFYIFYSIFNLKNFSLGSAAAPGEITGGLAFMAAGGASESSVFCLSRLGLITAPFSLEANPTGRAQSCSHSHNSALFKTECGLINSQL